MAVKKIIQNVFEQLAESGRDMAKSSVKQVKETISPWEMIRNSFTDDEKSKSGKGPQEMQKLKEMQGKDASHTPLDFDKLQKSYANQDQQKIDSMKQRLFQLVKREDEKTLQRVEQKKQEKVQIETHEEAEKKRRIEEQKRVNSQSAAPEGKSGRGTALSGKKKKRQPLEPQPAETKPGGGKQ